MPSQSDTENYKLNALGLFYHDYFFWLFSSLNIFQISNYEMICKKCAATERRKSEININIFRKQHSTQLARKHKSTNSFHLQQKIIDYETENMTEKQLSFQ